MSCALPVLPADDACANCGKGGEDGVKLKNCTACGLVKYCGVDCQKAHRKQHKKACKIRAAELKDEQLYGQGLERPEGDFCPICTMPIPLPTGEHSGFMACCMKDVCFGCAYAAKKRGMSGCPFCRTPYPATDADALAMIRARAVKKDPTGIFNLGIKYYYGELGLQKDMRRAVELWTEAAELGSIDALFNLGVMHDSENEVQEDKVKAIHFWTKAAMQGHAESRYQLGQSEVKKGNFHRAKKHFLISANIGDNDSVVTMKSCS